MSWQEKVLAGVRETSTRTNRSGPRGDWIGLLLRIHPDMRFALRQVSTRRDVSMTTYVRRLIAMAMINEGIGDLDYWLKRMPAAMPPNGLHMIHLTKGPQATDDGVGMAGMCTHPGCDKVHQ